MTGFFIAIFGGGAFVFLLFYVTSQTIQEKKNYRELHPEDPLSNSLLAPWEEKVPTKWTDRYARWSGADLYPASLWWRARADVRRAAAQGVRGEIAPRVEPPPPSVDDALPEKRRHISFDDITPPGNSKL